MGTGVLTAERPPFPRVGRVLLVHGSRATLVRRRERYADLVRGEARD